MQDEQMDHMDEWIREAANNHHPVYDDKAWEKMQALLDEHLPVKKKRKRALILFAVLSLAVLSFLLIQLIPNHPKQPLASAPAIGPAKIITLPGGEQETAATKEKEASKIKEDGSGDQLVTGNDHKRKAQIKITELNSRLATTKTDDDGTVVNSTRGAGDVLQDGPAVANGQAHAQRDENREGVVSLNQRITASPTKSRAQRQTGGGITATDLATVAATPGQGGKQQTAAAYKKGFANNFRLTASLAPDLSFTEMSHPGESILTYGAGISYAISNRITLRTGFYVARKVYSAAGDAYRPPSGYWTNRIKLDKVDADCNVYEIPLIASYSFKRSRKHQWLVGMGLSSFLMKRETYKYYFNDSLGQPRIRPWTLRNGNNEILSVATLTAGYEYFFNNRLSFTVEPYLKIPLHGIGYGNIKLNSAGWLLSASLRPFGK